MPYIYDLLAAALVLYYIYAGSRQGLASSVVRLGGYLVSLAAAWPLAKLAARHIFQQIFRESLLQAVTEKLAELPQGGQLADSAAELLESLPGYAGSLFALGGLSVQDLADSLTDFSQEGAVMVVDDVLAPALTGAMTLLLFVLIFSALLFFVRLLARFFRGANEIPVIGPVNSALGGLLGLVTGVIALYVILLLLQFVILLTDDALDFLNRAVLEQSFSYRLLARFDMLGFLSGF